MSRTLTLPTIPTIRPERLPFRSIAVLIEVPAVEIHRLKRTEPVVSPPASTRRPQACRPRRRLRRPVRMAGCALLTLVPMVSLCTLGWSNRPSRILACSISDQLAGEYSEDLAAVREPSHETHAGTNEPMGAARAVVLSIEPAAAASVADSVIPVFFPGYVLPDDGFEDSAHAGS